VYSSQDLYNCLAVYDWREEKLLFTARTTKVGSRALSHTWKRSLRLRSFTAFPRRLRCSAWCSGKKTSW
jgi:hypothetical protein